MKILMYKWKAYNHIDVEGNLYLRGHDIDIFDEPIFNVECEPALEEQMKSMLQNSSYDICFSINYFPIISDICEAHSLPYVYWTCDSQITCMYHESIFNSCNIGFIFDYMDYTTFKDFGANVHYLPLAGSIERVQQLLADSYDLENFQSQVSFVGSMYNKNLYDKAYEHLPEYLKGYFDCALTAQQDLYQKNIIPDILTSDVIYELTKVISKNPSKRSLSSEALVFSTAVLGFKAAQLERKSRLISISNKCNLDVYTDDETVDFGFADNKGEIDYWSDLPKLFYKSDINLNFTIKNIRTGIPLRVFDVLSAGGFLLTNFQSEMPLFFKNDVDFVWFNSVEEFEDKLAFYLDKPELRKQIALSGLSKIKEQHTYQHRFDEMARAVPNI